MRSDGPLVQTLSPSNPITLLQMLMRGLLGLLATIISPLQKKTQDENAAQAKMQYGFTPKKEKKKNVKGKPHKI